MEIVSFVNERPLGETNINDEDIPITPNMLATGRPMRQLRRFVALKNKPNCFYSDNALTFKSANKKLKALLGKGMDPVYNYAYYETAPVQWEFSTATAPWTNGATECMVGIFKKQTDCHAKANLHSPRDGRYHRVICK